MKLSDLTPNPANPRRISPERFGMLKASLEEFGDLSGIVYNRETYQLVGGHQRAKALPPDAKITITRKYETPTKTGTVAEGYVEIGSERMAYREVKWDLLREKAANIAANKHGGEWELGGLTEWLTELDASNYAMDLTGFSTADLEALMAPTGSSSATDAEKDLYSKKVTAPIYEPKGEKPKVSELVDTTKALKLIEEVRAARLPGEIEQFLIGAAMRHAVFDYGKIAEYYAHASAEEQELFEKSALVIIDFKKAIENGFAVLTEELAEAYPSGDDEEETQKEAKEEA